MCITAPLVAMLKDHVSVSSTVVVALFVSNPFSPCCGPIIIITTCSYCEPPLNYTWLLCGSNLYVGLMLLAIMKMTIGVVEFFCYAHASC